MDYLLAIDLETTGLDPEAHEIVQIGAILLDRYFEEIARFQTNLLVISPSNAHPKAIEMLKNQGLDVYPVEDYYRSEYVVPQLAIEQLAHFISENTLLKKHQFKTVGIFGQNVKFDFDFLKKLFEQNEYEFTFDYHIISLESLYFTWYFKKFGILPDNTKLKTICNALSVQNENPHNAMSDIETTVKLAKTIFNDLRIKL